MKEVSKKWQEEIKSPTRDVSISGMMWIKEESGLVAHRIPEDAIVQNSLTITDQLNTGKFSFGSVYLKRLSVKIDYTRCSDMDGKNINLTNAQIRFDFTLNYSDGSSETLKLDNFLVDSARSSRRENILIIYGVSCMSWLDITAEAMQYVKPYEIYKKACALARVRSVTTEEEFADFPNADKTFSFDTSQIKTLRDMLMWVAEITCTNALATVDYSDSSGGVWAVKLVQTPTKYTKAGTSGNFDLETFKADNGTVIPANIRYQSEFTDTSVRVTTVSMQCQGETITEHQNWTFAKDTLEGSMEIDFNPILENKSSDKNAIYTHVRNIERYVEQLRFCPFKTKFIGNPAIEVGDFVYLEAGGDIDETNFHHYGIVTYSRWTYPDNHEIRCATDLTAERPDDTSVASVMSTNRMMRAAPRSSSDVFGVQPKSQLEKRINAISGGVIDSITCPANGGKITNVQNAGMPIGGMQPNSADVSVSSGIFNMRTSTIRVNICPGNTYIETCGSNGEKITFLIFTYGIRYTREGGSSGSATISIETDSAGGNQTGGTIYFGNQSLGVRNGHLYINGTEKL